MNENTTRLFMENSIHYLQAEASSSPLHLPRLSEFGLSDEKTILSPLARRLATKPSIDSRLREAFKPVINDRNVLKPENYQSLMSETHAALIQQDRNEKETDAKEALGGLISLLEDNAGLMSLLDQFMNHVHKA